MQGVFLYEMFVLTFGLFLINYSKFSTIKRIIMIKIKAAALLLSALFLNTALASPSTKTDPGIKADYVLIKKSSRVMFLLKNSRVIKSYRVSLGKRPVGRKIYQGDHRTPEGKYKIEYFNPNSNFYYSLKISYPNELDKMIAQKLNVKTGGDIFIHGLPNKFPDPDSFRGRDWTKGCVALTNKEIKEVVSLVPVGTTVQIIP